MKYIVEVLSRPGSGAATTIYSNRDAAKDALDVYKYHRSGQPVVVLYQGKDEVEALIAVGTSNNSYYIIGSQETNNYFTNIISANNIIVDPIDVTELLSATGPGYDFDGDYKSVGTERHFGWLGTKSAEWALSRRGNGSWQTNSMSVQEMFEAILYGKKINKNVTPPDVTIELSNSPNGPWSHELILDSSNGMSQTVHVRLTCNITQISDNTIFNITPDASGIESNIYNMFMQGYGTIIYSCDQPYSVEPVPFIIDANNDGGLDSDTAYLYWNHKPDPEPGPQVDYVYTDNPTIKDEGTDFIIYFGGRSTWITNGQNVYFELAKGSEIIIINEPSFTTSTWQKNINASDYSLEEGVTYSYRACAIKDGKTIYGEWKPFTLGRDPIEDPIFTFIVASGEGTLKGYINDVETSSSETHSYNDKWKVEPSPAEGWEYDRSVWYIGTQSYSGSSDPITGTLTDNIRVYVYFKKKTEPQPGENYHNIYYEVYLNGSKVENPTQYVRTQGFDYPVADGHDITVNVSVKSGYTYSSMKIVDSDPLIYTMENYLTIENVTKDLTVRIYVEDANYYNIILSKSPLNADASLMINGEITQSKQFRTDETTSVLISCEPGDGWTFVAWKDTNGIVVSTSSSFTYTEKKTATFIAYFTNEEPSEKITITSRSENNTKGTVIPVYTNYEVESGYTDTLTATAKSGYSFKHWKLNDSIISQNTTINIGPLTAPGHYEYVAYFEVEQCNVTFKIEDEYKDNVKFSNGQSEYTIQVNKNSSINLPTDLNDHNYSIDYWIKDNGTTHIQVPAPAQTITENVTYTAYLKHEEQVRVQYSFPGSQESNTWYDAHNSALDLSNAFFKWNNSEIRQWGDYTNRNSTAVDVYIPTILNPALTQYSSNGLKTYINTNGIQVDVYTWGTSGWGIDPLGFNNTEIWERIDTNIYWWKNNNISGKDTIALKYKN